MIMPIRFFTLSILFFIAWLLNSGCNQEPKETKESKKYPVIGTIERLHADLDEVIPIDAKIEKIATGLTWAEGPLWVEEHQMLLCSDVKMDKIYKWTEKEGLSVFVEPSGFTGEYTDSREKGSNGLTLNALGELVMCQHGNRQIAKMDATLTDPKSKFQPVIDNYEGKKFNSPNDLIYDSKGNLYFTDPPYGLSEEMMNDPKKELDFQGCLLYTSPSPRDLSTSRMPSSA